MSANAYDQAEAAHAILLDWDGCVVEGGRLKPGATAFLCAFARKISILSNNSTHAPGQLAAILARASFSDIPRSRTSRSTPVNSSIVVRQSTRATPSHSVSVCV